MFRLKNNSGFSLVEMMVAAGITGILVLGGMRVIEYFTKETKRELGKMDSLSEFNLLTQDFLKFTENAGISTVYLNLPVKTKNCGKDEPCLKKLSGNTYVETAAGDIPSELRDNVCIQFYWDGNGRPESGRAYPEKAKNKDEITEIRPLDTASFQKGNELSVTWTLKDEKSPPIPLLKMRDHQVVLKFLRGEHFGLSKLNNKGKYLHSFYESEESPETVKQLTGYPFLIYNSLLNRHYTIQYAQEIISCKENASRCKSLLPKMSPSEVNNKSLSLESGADFPNKVFAIKFKEINFDTSIFKELKDRYKLPAECLASWGKGMQPQENYLFPSRAFSVSQDDSDSADLGGKDPVNVIHLSHYYTSAELSQDVRKGLMVAVPIDIVTFKVQRMGDTKRLQLVSELWHATDIKRKIKINDLKAPFVLARKLGSPELNLWYNPPKD